MIRNQKWVDIESNNAVPVNVQDQTTPSVILPAVNQLGSTTLAVAAVIDTYQVTVANSIGMSVGDHFRIINADADRYYFAFINDITGNIITLDTLVDFEYVVGSEVTYSNDNLGVDGSLTPVEFTLRTGSPSIPSVMDITRIIFSCITDSSVDLASFADIPRLTRGLTLRAVKNGQTRNLFNVKDNREIAALMYDWTPYAATNPAQGVDGFVSRLTFAGQNKIGVSLRIEAGDNLIFIVQDDLTDIVNLHVTFEGHQVQE